ncbi:MAG: hypothetical protein JST15_03735 [Bacteroidetes bacterium]|nr:hypothetical protein [Bacteroidota bacterium]
MKSLHQDYREFIELLNANKVEYLVVGAFALAFHGHPRYTGDIDFWVNNNEENSKRVYACIKEFGFPTSGLSENDFISDDLIFQIGYPPVRIDIITSLDALNFEESYKDRVEEFIDDLKISFLCLEDFKKNKKAVGRFKDLADLEGLE